MKYYTKEGYVVIFHTHTGALQADVTIALDSNERTYTLPVILQEGINIDELKDLREEQQKTFVHVFFIEDASYVYVGLLNYIEENEQNEEERRKFKKRKTESTPTNGLGTLNELPLEVIEYILTRFLSPTEEQQVREVSKTFNSIISNSPYSYSRDLFNLRGLLAYSSTDFPNHHRTMEKVMDFSTLNWNTDTVPTLLFYRLIGKVKNLPQEFWPYLNHTNIHTIDLKYKLPASMAIEFVQSLQGSKVEEIDLGYNGLGPEVSSNIGLALHGTNVRKISLSHTSLGSRGAKEFVQALQGTGVEVVDLTCNGISPDAIKEVAKHLADNTVIKVAILKINFGGKATKSFLEREYPNIRWEI